MSQPTIILYIRDDGLTVTRDGEKWGSQRVEPNPFSIGHFMLDLQYLGVREYVVKDERSEKPKKI